MLLLQLMAPKSKPPVPKVPVPKAPTAAQLKALKESKGIKSKETVKPVSDSKVSQMKKDTVQAKVNDILNSNTKLNKAENLIKGAILARGGYSAAANTFSVGKTAVDAVKKLQRDLSSTEKEISMKGMSKQKRLAEGERRSELTPEEYMEFNKGNSSDLRKQISEAMKKKNKKK